MPRVIQNSGVGSTGNKASTTTNNIVRIRLRVAAGVRAFVRGRAMSAGLSATVLSVSNVMAYSSSSTCLLVSERHNSTGIIKVNTMTSLNALAQKDE
ncbi:hypothetical protein D3C72_956560 [compost metagenome]